jgi:hypothetical protein
LISLGNRLSSAAKPEQIVASEKLHQRVLRALNSTAGAGTQPSAAESWFSWRVALPAAAIAVVLALVLFQVSSRHSNVSSPLPPAQVSSNRNLPAQAFPNTRRPRTAHWTNSMTC